MRFIGRLLIVLSVIVPLLSAGDPALAQAPSTSSTDERGLPTLAPVLKQVLPGVVSIAVQGRMPVEQNPLYQDPFFRRYFGIPDQPPEREFQSAGSGVIIDAAKGYVLTNNHVVERADRIAVGLHDGRRLEAKLIGADPEADVALLRVPPQNLTAVPFGDSDTMQVGDYVIAIGNPFGLGQTVTSGIISALGRSGLGIEGYEDFIQTDAAINPGNSGGALVDLRGRLIGINTAIVGPTQGNVGIGFAIPINMAREITDQLHRYGKVRRGQLGVVVQDLPANVAAKMAAEGRGGATVMDVAKGSAADKAGIRKNDVIAAVNARPVRSAGDLRNRIGMARVNQKVDLQVVRNGKVLMVTAKIDPREK